MSTEQLSDEDRVAADEVSKLYWFEAGTRPAFRGSLGGRHRQIVGDTFAELKELAFKMARREA